jgi:predicted porin
MNTPEGLIKQAKLMEGYGANCIYVTDSAGYMLPDDVRPRCRRCAMRSSRKPNSASTATTTWRWALPTRSPRSKPAPTASMRRRLAWAPGQGNTPMEVFIAVCDRMGIETGVDTFKISDVAEDRVVPIMDHIIRIDRDSLTLGYAGVYSSFLLFAKRAEKKYGISARDILVELGRRGMVGGQEDMIEDTAMTMASAGKGDAAFDRRQGNSLQYWTPNFGGFSGRVGYSFDEGKSGSTAVAEISPNIWSLSAGYANNGFSLQYAYEQHNDYFGLSAIGGGAAASASNSSSKDSGHKLVGMYTIGATKLTAIVEQLRYRNDDSGNAANVDEYKRNAFVVGVQQTFGPGKAWLNFGKASDGSCTTVGGITCNTDGMGATYWNLGYVHSVHKLVDLFASYYNIDNDESGTYQPTFMLNVAPGSTPAPGLGIRGLGVGAVMAF